VSTATLEQRRVGASFVGLAAWMLMAGAVLQLVLGIPLAYLEAETPPSAAIVALNILNHLLLMVGIAGLARSQAAGRRSRTRTDVKVVALLPQLAHLTRPC
jgi:hypothetical protein